MIMIFPTKSHAPLVIALMASATGSCAFAESGRPAEPAAQVVVMDACAPARPAESQGSYYTYLRVVDGMTRDSALEAARHVDKPTPERPRTATRESASGVVSTAAGASAVLR
jgi:hypothetical protein